MVLEITLFTRLACVCEGGAHLLSTSLLYLSSTIIFGVTAVVGLTGSALLGSDPCDLSTQLSASHWSSARRSHLSSHDLFLHTSPRAVAARGRVIEVNGAG